MSCLIYIRSKHNEYWCNILLIICREGLQHDGEDRHHVSTLTWSCLTQCITGMQDQCLVSLLSVGDHAGFAEFCEECNPRVQHRVQGVITWQLRGDEIVFTGMEDL